MIESGIAQTVLGHVLMLYSSSMAAQKLLLIFLASSSIKELRHEQVSSNPRRCAIRPFLHCMDPSHISDEKDCTHSPIAFISFSKSIVQVTNVTRCNLQHVTVALLFV